MLPVRKMASCQSVSLVHGVLSGAIPALTRAWLLISRQRCASTKSMRCGTSCTP
jgi:hypothetical protein